MGDARYRERMSQSTKPHEKQVAPAVKAWLDNVLVPAMVKQWFAAWPEGHAVNSSAKSHNAESEEAKLR
jgi:hypothetical protein